MRFEQHISLMITSLLTVPWYTLFAITVCPSCSRRSTRSDPRKPALPVAILLPRTHRFGGICANTSCTANERHCSDACKHQEPSGICGAPCSKVVCHFATVADIVFRAVKERGYTLLYHTVYPFQHEKQNCTVRVSVKCLQLNTLALFQLRRALGFAHDLAGG